VTILAVATILFGAGERLHAQAFPTWQGSGTNWTDAGNWNTAFGYGQLQWTGGGNSTSWNNRGTTDMWRFFFNGGTSYTLDGDTVRFFDFGGASGGVLNEGTGNQTINMNLSFRDSGSRPAFLLTTNTGGLTFNNIEVTSNVTSLGIGGVNSGSTVAVGGVLSGNKDVIVGTNALSGNTTSMGNTRAVFSGNNTYSAATTVANGALTLAHANALGSTNSGTTVASGASLRLSNSIAVAGEALSLNGTGIDNNGALVSVNGSNDYTGVITLAGTAYLGATNSSSLTVSNVAAGGNELWVVGAGTTTIAGGATNSGSGTAFVKTGSGVAVLAGSNAWSGAEFIREGTVVLSNNNALGVGGTTTIGSNSVAAATLRIGQGIINSNAINVEFGSGTKTLSYQSGSGTGSQLGSISLNNSSLAFNVTNGGTLLIGGGVSAPSGGTDVSRLAIDGGGVLIVTNAGTGIASTDRYQVRIGNGTMVIGAGTIIARTNVTGLGHAIDLGVDLTNGIVNAASSLRASNGVTVSNSIFVSTTNSQARVLGASGADASVTFSGPVGLAGAGLTLDATNGQAVTVSGAITNFSGTGSLIKTGVGTATLSGANTYGGATTIAGGTLQIDANSRLGNTNTTLTISNGGILRVTSAGGITNVITIGTGDGVLSNASPGAVTYSGAVSKNGTTLTSRSGSGTNVFTGVISGASANSDFVVDGGTTVFSNQMTYNGPTIVTNSGTLVLKVDNALPSGSNLVLGGGTFLVGDSTQVYGDDSIGSMTLSANSTIDFGTSTDTTTRDLKFANSSAISWVGTLTITNWTQAINGTNGAYGRLYFSSDTNGLTSGQLGQISFNLGGTLYGAKYLSDGEIVADITPIPEPRVYAAALVLLATVGWRERKKLRRLLAGSPSV
jgi:autotransporter-associated beta strand protein